MIPISVVDLGPDVEASVLEVLRSGIVAQGPKVAELERRFAQLTGVAHAVAVNNGTTALVAALEVMDLEPGDEVVTSPFTFVATLNAILEAGATVRFADVRGDDYCLDAEAAATVVGSRTKVLLPVHLYGQTADMGAVMALAASTGASVVEDAAQAHGAAWSGRRAGAFGLGCFSFYATKNITTGEGGMITTDDAGLADRLRLLRNQGMRERYMYDVAGHNYRMTDLQAALALPQLGRYAEQVRRRQANAELLRQGLADVPGLALPFALPGREHVWHQFTVVLDEHAKVDRAGLGQHLTERGIGNGIYYPRLVHDYACFRDRPDVVVDPTPVAARLAVGCLSLPVHAKLSPADVEAVVEAVREALV